MQANHGERGRGLVLVGYRGTGKSTVGRIVADRAGREFVEVDAEIERRAGRSIRAIFAEDGEPAFRDMEEEAVRGLVRDFPGAVLATGGGTVMRATNRGLLRGHGLVVWLRAEPAELARRIEADAISFATRPALTAAGPLAEIPAVLAARTPAYREAADHEVEAQGHAPERIAEQILALWTAGA
ncbi:Shikimate kinase 1 [Aquisphaera giovannonii]|uniref:Shikimate kinase n=1 Tax=Aquisphaera giovannonii TaxID=406548 RepID=A0A5B9W7Y3_9BACT|nr:shikimate kinase [Aquisphaera giovannonii]QEH36802.1 Shikimate kinase 1 [Aquisphaera giovannonii]